MSHSPALRWGAIGLACSAVVLVILLLLDSPPKTTTDAPEDVVELIGPSPLQDDSGIGKSMMDPDMSVSLPEGGWLQVAGDDGQLAQQYRFTHLEPDPPNLPDNWIALQEPVVEMFMNGGRLITLAGDQAVAYAPRRALEEGRLIGHVVIQMFESVNGQWPDPKTAPAAMTVNTTTASFDNLSGRITCDGDVLAVTPTEEMRGQDLQILLNDRDDRIEFLRMDRVDYLLLRDVGHTPATARIRPRVHPQVLALQKQQGRNVTPVTYAPDQDPFYILTMTDDVRIVQAPGEDAPDPRQGRVATADTLKVFFSFKSSAFTTDQSPPTAALGGPQLLAAMAIGLVPPTPDPDEVVITCNGPLEMVPLEDASLRPPASKDIRLELIGKPVNVRDLEQDITITCGLLTWRSETERVDLASASQRHVIITTDDLRLESDSVWARPEAGLAGIDANGTATLASKTTSPNTVTTITWQQEVDIAFDPASDDADQGLRSIRFVKDVDVVDEGGTMTTDDLTMQFEPGPDGQAQPRQLTAINGVRAANDQQVLWAQQLNATIEAIEASDDSDTTDTQLDVRQFNATGGVQVLMADGGRIWADRMEGDAQQEIIDLTGDNVTIARSEVVIGQGHHLRVQRLDGIADWNGGGRALMLGTPIDVSMSEPIARPPLPPDPGPQDTQIDWTGGVHIDFDPASDSDDVLMRSIAFTDNVQVAAPDGSIRANELTMEFAPDENGKAQPDRLICTTRVLARNDQQSLWADHLVATLEPAEPSAQNPDQVEPATETTSGFDTGNVVVRDFDATGDVQVLMADGARAFADRLQGDALQETAQLTGDDVLIARSDVIIDRGHDLQLDRHAGSAHWTGAGRSRMLATPIDLTMDARMPPPRIVGNATDPQVTMRTTWSTSMHYDSTFADGAGAIDIVGAVDSVVDRSDLERSSLKGDTLRLEFSRIVPLNHTTQDAASEPLPPTPEDTAINPFASGDRVLERLIAKGNARLESRTWPTPQRAALPRVFYVGAKHITWNDLKTEAQVVGNGDLIIRESDWEGGKRASDGPFSGPGTSRFTWSQRLDLVQEADDRFQITMTGDVQGQWKSAIDRRDIATITAQNVQVLTRRGEKSIDADSSAPLELGSDMEVDRLRAIERVYLATPTRRADCHELDYNTRTRIAELAARPGRTVSLITEGSPMPVQATHMVWNMDPDIDTITLERPRGSGVP